MKFLKSTKSKDTTIRKVVTDDRTQVLCVIGTIGDLLNSGILEWSDLDSDLWLAISNLPQIEDCTGRSRKEALKHFLDAGF